jgi:hypothetical protein
VRQLANYLFGNEYRECKRLKESIGGMFSMLANSLTSNPLVYPGFFEAEKQQGGWERWETMIVEEGRHNWPIATIKKLICFSDLFSH